MMLSAARPCTCMTWELSLVELSPHIPGAWPMLLPVIPDIDCLVAGLHITSSSESKSMSVS